MNSMFRLLRADEIECRVKQCTEKGAMVLLYKDARCDMNILDETVGAMNWKKSYQLIDGQLFCTLEIWDEDKKQWIGKQDVGVESNTEVEKGRASDAQKRSAVAFGIGRELYTAPFIWIKAELCKKLKQNDKGVWQCFDKFKVRLINYDNSIISYLVIENERHEVVFTYGSPDTSPRKRLTQYCREHDLDLHEIAEKYEIDKKSSDEDIEKALEDLKNECK